ncbi:IS1380 family transposase [Syntrophorhabdus aromaticivorans]|uniref:IS1380 family transposase n=1 Tax=Syntrophorhabdus aromaticivorans TaxID=328301 RepID=UPI000421C8A1|nr:IS1380 family transposase [Syntrophorhabdus aromaticivorans]
MPQGILPYKYEEESTASGMTSLAGLPVYLDLASILNLGASISQHLHIKIQGWTDEQIVMTLILLNLAGGDFVDDLRLLEADEGFCKILQRIELKGLKRKGRREIERRWRKEKHRSVPSPSAVFRYLAAFHEDYPRIEGSAIIPPLTESLSALERINADLVAAVHKRNPIDHATLDMDATLIQTSKKDALFSYKGYKAYQPLNTYFAELGLVLHTEFRDGNVPAGYEQLRVFLHALSLLPPGVKTVRLRSDTAGYQHELLSYCDRGKDGKLHERFGRIEFAIGAHVTKEFRKAVGEADEWHPIRDKKGHIAGEWAEVCFVPNAECTTKKGQPYRYLAIRELMKQPHLPMEGLPFQTITFDETQYKLFGIVTNMNWEGEELIHWYHKRCGKSEEAHASMKEDLAGGRLPSGDFGENAAWWSIMALAHNLNTAMKNLVLRDSWVAKRMKAIRFHLINLPGRIVDHARGLSIRLTGDHPSLDIPIKARMRIMELGRASPG